MGQYKVPQNVETEDKILGPLSVKQFIYVIIAIMWAFLMWRVFSFAIVLAVIFALPVTGFFLLLGFGQREGVPFEDYVVAFFRFLIIPRRRVWMKDDSKDVLIQKAEKPNPETLVAPKHVTTGQLKQLAAIIDAQGGQKDPSIQLTDESNAAAAYYSQRIIGPTQSSSASSGPITVENQFATATDDILDETGARSAQVGELLQSAETDVRDKAVAQLQQALTQPAAPTKPKVTAVIHNQPAAQQNVVAGVIAKQANNLPVNIVAQRASQQQLAAGQSVNLRQAN